MPLKNPTLAVGSDSFQPNQCIPTQGNHVTIDITSFVTSICIPRIVEHSPFKFHENYRAMSSLKPTNISKYDIHLALMKI